MRDNCQCPLHAAFLQQQQKAPMYPHAIGSKKTNKQTNKQTEHLPHAAGSSQVLFFFLLLLLLLLFSPRGPAVGATASEFTAECPPNV